MMLGLAFAAIFGALVLHRWIWAYVFLVAMLLFWSFGANNIAVPLSPVPFPSSC